ncbi:MAG TPA: amidase family protein [Candidatus Binatia bacterium]|nr:amidase family protein [Candidatus Binatia bacterium]
MTFDEYAKHDALGLAERIAQRAVTAGELLEVAIARAEAVNPRLGAIVYPLYEMARERARQPLSGPFAGVPFLTKDLFQEIAGAPTAFGCKGMKAAGFRAPFTAEITARWLKAGAVIFGRTNTPEFGAKAITEPDAWFPARNPWNPDHTPGGSSGGSAAAVAAGVVPMAGANDGGGSIRIPAAHCGLFGLKPGRGRTPWGPAMSEAMHGAAMNHVVSRTVRDSAAMLDATQGSDLGTLNHLAPPERPYLEEASREPGRLRIAFSTASPIGTDVHPEAVQAVRDAAALLESLGHQVEEGAPQLDGMQLAKDFLVMWFAQCAATVRTVKAQTGCGNDGFELDTRAMAAFGDATRASDYVEGYWRWGAYTRALAEFHQRHDLWLTPTLALPPARIGEVVTPPGERAAVRVVLALGLERLLLKTGLVEKMARENLKWVPFTQLANLTGVPAMSVPLHWTAAGLPLGVQLVAAHGGEGLLFRLAGQLERARPWAQRRPAM